MTSGVRKLESRSFPSKTSICLPEDGLTLQGRNHVSKSALADAFGVEGRRWRPDLPLSSVTCHRSIPPLRSNVAAEAVIFDSTRNKKATDGNLHPGLVNVYLRPEAAAPMITEKTPKPTLLEGDMEDALIERSIPGDAVLPRTHYGCPGYVVRFGGPRRGTTQREQGSGQRHEKEEPEETSHGRNSGAGTGVAHGGREAINGY